MTLSDIAYEDTAAEMVYRHSLRDGRRQASASLIQWLRDPNRKPAHLHFTAGPERELADMIEAAIRAKEEGDA